MTAAELFHQGVNLDDHPDLGPALLAFVEQELGSGTDGPPLREQLGGVRRGSGHGRGALAPALTPAPPLVRCRELLVAYAPLGLLDGTWLGGCSNAATHHTDIGAELLRLHWQQSGEGVPARHRGNMYRVLAESAGVELPELSEPRFARLPIPDAAFRLALVRLALARFARAFLPEIIGFALFDQAAGLPPPLLAARDPLARAGADARFFAAREPDPALEARLFELAGRAGEARCARGLGAAARLDAAWLAATARAPTPRERMAALLREKAPLGHGYHKARELGGSAGGTTIDALLDPAAFDAERVLRALAVSSYVVAGSPARSRLLAEVCAPGGSMAGVYTPEEIAVIAAWIESLPRSAAEPAAIETAETAETAAPPPPPPLPPLPPTAPAADDAALPPRELYHRLVNADRFPGVARAAHRYADRAFGRVRRSAWRARYQRFFRYTPEALDAWCLERHRWQVAQYRPLTGRPLLSRAQALWLLHQISPMTLVDGCWLQGVCARSAAGAVLLRTYRDEVGAGVPADNHANIHRAVLADAGIELPAVDSRELAAAPDLVDAAFELPALWLAVACASRRYFPELLGLNFAMEFAGIGGPYMQFADLLRHHGIRPTIVELHNTIDNLASGHTAWARDAIHAHLADARAAGGDPAVQLVWQRIWTGYRAHDVLFGRFSRACALRLLPRVFADWLTSRRRPRLAGPA
ncbi:MAG TPA: iron-containing redox enzyme family protein [Kofleriaceae bacterium]|nr:iron-containing redox enzyme family protein [Kofleriaceae bacterium]